MNPESDQVDERALERDIWLRLIPSAKRADVARVTVGYLDVDPTEQQSTLPQLREDVYRTILDINARVNRQKTIPELNAHGDVAEVRKYQSLRILGSLDQTIDDIAALAWASMDTNTSVEINRRAWSIIAEVDWCSGLTLGECLTRSRDPSLHELGRSLPARLDDSHPVQVLMRWFDQVGATPESRSARPICSPVELAELGRALGVIIAWLAGDSDPGRQQAGLRLADHHATLIAPLLRERLGRRDLGS